ncbi:MAG: hypothetical protein ABF370_21960 [Verrucomicrobiales bacterium]
MYFRFCRNHDRGWRVVVEWFDASLVAVADGRALPGEKEIEPHFEELEALELISIEGMGLADAVGAAIPTPLFVMTSLLLGGMLGAKP